MIHLAQLAQLAAEKSMDNDRNSSTYWPKRRELLRQQALLIRRLQAENAGQLTLPIFGTGAEKLPMLREAASLTVEKGMHLSDVTRRKA